MKKIKLIRFALLAVVAAGFIVFNGCGGNDNVVTPVTTITVNGKTVDLNGNSIAGLTASIGTTNTVTAADGSFTIANVTVPYDLKLVQASGSSPSGFLYQGLTTSTPSLFTSGLVSTPNSNTLTVNIPAMTASQKALIFFTDEATNEKFGYILPAATSTSLAVQWNGTATLTGKVIVMICTFSGATLVSYDKYGEKTGFVLNNGGTSSTTFSASDLTTNPGESTVSGTLTAPAGYTNVVSTVGFTFRSGVSYVFSTPVMIISGTSFSFLAPTGIASSFKIIVEGAANGLTLNSKTNKFVQVLAGSTANSIVLDETPTLSTPPNASVSVDTTTNFVFAPGAGSGINFIAFNSATEDFYVFTNATSVKIPNFSSYGLGLSAGNSFTWKVTKFGNINTLDQFVSAPLINNPGLTSTANTETRTFTTAP